MPSELMAEYFAKIHVLQSYAMHVGMTQNVSKSDYTLASPQASTRNTLTSTLIAFIVNREANDDNYDRFLRTINLLAS